MKFRFLFLIFVVSVFAVSSCDQKSERRKIKLSEEIRETRKDDQLTTTIQLEPRERRSIAIMFFQNLTGDNNLEWLQKGLTEMLIRALSQSRYISVLSTDRLYEIMERLNKEIASAKVDLDMAAIVAREANVEAILVGNITKSGNELKIEVKLKEPNRGLVLKEESVEGSGMEKIFAMVDQLSERIKSDLNLSLDKVESTRGIAEVTTKSLEAWRYFTDGTELFNKIIWQDASEHFQKAIELDSTFISARFYLALSLMLQGKEEQASQQLDRLDEFKSNAIPQELYQINLLKANLSQDIGTAIEIIGDWLEDYPEDRDAHMDVATFYFGLHNYEKAISHYKRILEIDPNYKLAYNQLGYSYAFMGNFEEAIEALKKYIEMVPDEPNPYDSLGEIYLLLGEYDQAEQSFNQALKIESNFYASQDHIASVYMDRGDFEKALEMLREYNELVPDGNLKAYACSRIAQLNWQIGKKREAILNFEKALPYANSKYAILENLHLLNMEIGDSSQAEKLLIQNYEQIKNQLRTDYTQFMPIFDLVQLSLWHNVNMEESIELIKKSVEELKNQPTAMQVKFLLSILLNKANRKSEIASLWQGSSNTEFVTFFREVRSFSYTGFWKFYFLLNELYYDDLQTGIDYYQQIVNIFKDNNSKMPEMIFRLFLAELYNRNDEPDKAHAHRKQIGMPTEDKWMVLAPFENRGGFHKKFEPEKRIKFDKTYRTKSGRSLWQSANDGKMDGFINLRDIYADSRWSVGYGFIYLKSPEDRDGQFRIGSNASVKVWLNDEEIWTLNNHRNAIFDDDIIRVTLKKGLNEVLIKVCNQAGGWGYYFRVTDEEGNGFDDIEFVSAAKSIN